MPEERSYTLRLNEEEIARIRSFLVNDSDEDLDLKIYQQMRNGPLQNVLWFNLYYEQQVYGGQEEGGWYYWITECVYSLAFPIYCSDHDLREKNARRMLMSFFKKCAKEANESDVYIDKPSALYEAYVDDNGKLVMNNYARYTENSDHNYMRACFEYAPGIQHHMERQHYC